MLGSLTEVTGTVGRALEQVAFGWQLAAGQSLSGAHFCVALGQATTRTNR